MWEKIPSKLDEPAALVAAESEERRTAVSHEPALRQEPPLVPHDEIELTLALMRTHQVAVIGRNPVSDKCEKCLAVEGPGADALADRHASVWVDGCGTMHIRNLAGADVSVERCGTVSEVPLFKPSRYGEANYTDFPLARGDIIRLGDGISFRVCEPPGMRKEAQVSAPPETARALDRALEGMVEGERAILGRSPQGERTIALDSPSVDDCHAALTALGDGCYRLQDLGSVNGTYLYMDGMFKRIEEDTIVGPGDKIFLGFDRYFVVPIETGPIDGVRHRGVSTDLRRERCGRPGYVRSEFELTTGHAVRVLHDQLREIGPRGVDAIIDHFPEEQRTQARIVLAQASQYGSLDALADVAKGVKEHLPPGRRGAMYIPGGHSLGNNLQYLNDSKCSFDPAGARSRELAVTSEIRDASVLVLDEAILHKLQTDPLFTGYVIAKQVKLICPVGLDSGINMFNAVTPDEIEKKIGEVLRSALAIQKESGDAFDAAVRAALEKPMLDRLRAIENNGVGWQPGQLTSLVTMLPGPRARDGSAADFSSERISRQLNGSIGISTSELNHALESVHPGYRDLMREMITQLSAVNSSRSLAGMLRSQHAHIMRTASENGIPPEKVYYMVPQSKKSYGLITMAYQMTNGIPASQFLSGPTAPMDRNLGADTMVVILDDVAGSGNTLHGAYRALRPKNPIPPVRAFEGHITISPVISTRTALAGEPSSNDPNFIKSMKADALLHYLPGRVTPQFAGTQFVKRLDPVTRALAVKLVGNLGYGDNGLLAGFPYMAPDNNCALWILTRLAHHFTINGQGVKSETPAYFSGPSTAQFEKEFEDNLVKLSARAREISGEEAGKSVTDLAEMVDIYCTLRVLDRLQEQFGFRRSEAHGELLAQLLEYTERVAAIRLEEVERLANIAARGADPLQIVSASIEAAKLQDGLQAMLRIAGDESDLCARLRTARASLVECACGPIEKRAAQSLTAMEPPEKMDLASAWQLRRQITMLMNDAKTIGVTDQAAPSLPVALRTLRQRVQAPINRQLGELERIWEEAQGFPSPADVINTRAYIGELQTLTAPIAMNIAQTERLLGVSSKLSAFDKFTETHAKIERALTGGVEPFQMSGRMRQILELRRLGQPFGRDVTEDMAGLKDLLLRGVREYMDTVPHTSSHDMSDWVHDITNARSVAAEGGVQISGFAELQRTIEAAIYTSKVAEINYYLDRPHGVCPKDLCSWQELIHSLEELAKAADVSALPDMERLTAKMIEAVPIFVAQTSGLDESTLSAYVEHVELARRESLRHNLSRDDYYHELISYLESHAEARRSAAAGAPDKAAALSEASLPSIDFSKGEPEIGSSGEAPKPDTGSEDDGW